MRELLEAIDQCSEDAKKQILTCLDEKYLGEKCLVVDGKLSWMQPAGEKDDDSFFCWLFQKYLKKYPQEREKLNESGWIKIAGTDVFCDAPGREKHLVICGGGHVSIPVIRMGRMIGFKVTVFEDRPKFADAARNAGADAVYCEAFSDSLQRIEGNTDTYFVIVTRGHRYDEECLEKISKKEHAYIGMIGSRRRVALVKEHLLEIGCKKEVLDQLYSPIGLNIGAETPEEIAVAIIAEIIEVKNKKKRNWGISKEIKKVLLDVNEEMYGHQVLATIIERKGSAPQGVGVKMLICENGTCTGTIGGGCMEAEVVRNAKVMMHRQTDKKACIYTVDLRDSDAGDEGMVCGGAVKVLLETIC